MTTDIMKALGSDDETDNSNKAITSNTKSNSKKLKMVDEGEKLINQVSDDLKKDLSDYESENESDGSTAGVMDFSDDDECEDEIKTESKTGTATKTKDGKFKIVLKKKEPKTFDEIKNEAWELTRPKKRKLLTKYCEMARSEMTSAKFNKLNADEENYYLKYNKYEIAEHKKSKDEQLDLFVEKIRKFNLNNLIEEQVRLGAKRNALIKKGDKSNKTAKAIEVYQKFINEVGVQIKVKRSRTRADKTIDGIKYYINADKAQEQLEGKISFKNTNTLFSRCEDTDEFIQIMEDAKNPRFYEVCNKNTKLMADLEDYPCSDYEMIVKFKKFLKEIFGRVGIEYQSKYCKFLVDSSENKRSMHFIYNNGMVFENNGKNTTDNPKFSQWEFWEFVKNIIFTEYDGKNEELKYKDFIIYKKQKKAYGSGNTKEIIKEMSSIDFNVYTKNHPMRCMLSKKDPKKGQEQSPRTFYPCKIDNEKKCITLLKKIKLKEKHLINDYSEKPEFYKLDIELPQEQFSYRNCRIDEVTEIILDEVNDVEIGEVKGNLIALKNVGKRECLISGEVHENNNAYIVVRPKDGIYYYCHSDKCDTADYCSDYEKDSKGGLCIHKFPKQSNAILEKINRTNRIKAKGDGNSGEVIKKVDELVYDDINRMLRHMDSEQGKVTPKGKVKEIDGDILTQESRDAIIAWAFETIKYVSDAGVDSCYVKCRIYDHKLKTETIDWVKRTKEHIFKNKDYLSIDYAQFSDKLTFKTLGPLVEWLVRTHQIERYDKVTCIPYYDEKPKLRYTLNLFSEYYLKKEMDTNKEWDKIDVNLFKESETYRHFKENICANNLELFEYHMNFISHMILKPGERADVTLIFYGKGGTGKDLHSKFLSNLMGGNLCHAYKSLDDFLTQFNILNKNKILCVIDEVDDKASRKNHNDFKHMQTTDKEKIESKGIDPDYFPCYKRFIANTNYRDSWRVEHDCRRLVMYEIARGLIRNKKWINALLKEMDDINMLKSAFKFFAKRNISEYNPRFFPVTDYKKQQASMNIKSSFQFLNHLTDLDDIHSDLSKELYENCTDKDLIDKKKYDDDEKENDEKPANVMDESDDESESDKEESDEDKREREKKKEEKKQEEIEKEFYLNPKYPNTSKHSYEFKQKDLYKLYKKYCEEFSLNMCKPPAFKQDMIQMEVCPMNNNKLKKFRSSVYGGKPITGYQVVNEDLVKKLADELGMDGDAYKF